MCESTNKVSPIKIDPVKNGWVVMVENKGYPNPTGFTSTGHYVFETVAGLAEFIHKFYSEGEESENAPKTR